MPYELFRILTFILCFIFRLLPRHLLYHTILWREEQYFFGKACYIVTAYVKIRQILCTFEKGKVTKETKTGG